MLFLGCDKSNGNILNSKISIKSSKGHFVSADKNNDRLLISNRSDLGNWEIFFIEKFDNNKVTFRTNEYSNVQINDKSQLYFGSSEEQEKEVFSTIKIDSTSFILQSSLGNYVTLDSNSLLIAKIRDRNKAEIFVIKEYEKITYGFSTKQLIPLIFGFILLCCSFLFFQHYKNLTYSVMFLLLGGFCFRLFIALLNSHLNLWDEQFHALVAKNMMENPFSPMLYKNPILNPEDLNWIGSHIWLHKQPLFLWQMALSMKIFGVNTFAVRLPSVILSTIVIYFIYRIGKLIVNNKVGFYGALLFSVFYFCLELVAGGIATDHNDISFLFYVSASIWAWVEYENSTSKRRRLFLVLIGVFSGCAILVKWLTGLLVFAGWGMSIILDKNKRKELVNYSHIILSFVVAVLTFLPWQIYISSAFPVESKHEYTLNTSHFFNVIEGHGGTFWYHFEESFNIYGLNFFFILFCLILLFYSIKKSVYKIAFITYVVLIYLFFSIAATKMISFTFCISFIIFLAFGVFLDKFFKTIIINKEYLKPFIYSNIFKILILSLCIVFSLNLEQVKKDHTMWLKNEKSDFFTKEKDIKIIQNLDNSIKNSEEYIVFNCKDWDNISVMFFNDFLVAYCRIPTYETYQKIKTNYKIAIFDDGKLPDYLLNDENVLKLNKDYFN